MIIKTPENKKVLSNGLYMLMLQVFNVVVPMITVPHVTRILGTEGYGIFSLALNWVAYCQVIVEYGFALSATRKASLILEGEKLNRLYTCVVLGRIFLCVLAALVLAVVFLMSGKGEDFLLCTVVLYLVAVSAVIQSNWLLQGKQNMRPIAIIGAVAKSVSVGLIFIFVRTRADVYLYCLLYAFPSVIIGILGMCLVYKQYCIKIIRVTWLEILDELKDGWHVFTSSFMSKLFGGIGITILGFYVSDHDVGTFSAIIKIPTVLTVLFTAVSQTIYPNVCRKFSESYRNGISQVTKYCVPVMLVVFAAAAVVAVSRRWIVGLLFGPEYVAFSDVIIPCLLWAVFAIGNNFLGIQTLVASGNQKEYSIAFALGTFFLIVYNVALIWIFGVRGAAWAMLISECTLTMLLIVMLAKIPKN